MLLFQKKIQYKLGSKQTNKRASCWTLALSNKKWLNQKCVPTEDIARLADDLSVHENHEK